MPKRLILFLLCAAMVFAFTGCIELRAYAPETSDVSETPQNPEDLPTLPMDNSADLIPLDVFTSYFEYTPPDISNDGDKILYRHINGFSDSYIVENWKTGEQTAVQFPADAYGIPYCLWAPDGENMLFFVDNMGDENYGLYTSNIETGGTKTILPGGTTNCYYVADNPKNDKEIYIEILNPATEKYDLYVINYETGVKKLIMDNPGNITAYLFDNDGNFEAVTTNDDRAGKHVWLNKGFDSDTTEFSQDDWKKIFSWNYEDADTSGIWGMLQGGKELVYADSSKSNTSTLYYYDIATGESSEIFNDPNYDISGTWTDLELNKVTAVMVEGQKMNWHVLDSSFQDDYDVLRTAGDNFQIYDSSEGDKYWIVAYMSDVKETDYYLYDMAKHELKFLYNAQPDLNKYEFAPMEPFSYTASDELKIEGYATFPTGMEKSNLPTVMLVHGGPWSRDTWGYNQEVQLLANRGYLVLQVNFRGSTGYGKNFMNAGDKEWGGKMHQDILDAVNYAVGQGWTDADRVGVYGASYGGYEALACAAFSSDVFKCSVDAFGPSSLLTFVDSLPPQWSVEYQDLINAVGDPKTESEFMKQRSPLYYAEDMKIPLLIAQGSNDPRVPQRESDQMAEALRDAGIPVTYMLFPDTGHGFGSDADRIKFYSEMEKFFAENLGGKMEK